MQYSWNPTPQEAIELQKKLREEVKIEEMKKMPKLIGGADVSFDRFSNNIVFAGIVVMTFPELEIVEEAVVKTETKFPYIPGLLSFREAPALIEVWKKLKMKPDVLMVDGQGIAHPRHLGIASHLGIVLDVPTIGCAKSLLYGTYTEPAEEAGSTSVLYDRHNRAEPIGVVVRTKQRVKPVFVSPGHKITIEEAVEIVKTCVRGYRLPEPTRQAHELVNVFRRREENS